MSRKTRKCCNCGKVKPLSGFSIDNGTGGCDGLHRECRGCQSIRHKCYYNKNKREICERTKRNHRQRRLSSSWRLKERTNRCASNIKRYGITVEQYDQMFEEQDGVCAICGKPQTMVHGKSGVLMRLYIDHDHKTGRVRGLLCSSCNLRLAVLEDKEFCKNSMKYLRDF